MTSKSMPGNADLHHDQGTAFIIYTELKKAVEFQRAGHIAAAERLYLDILERNPSQPDALHLLGIIAHQNDDNDEAENLISNAIKNAPSNPYYLNNLGAVFKAKGKITEALGCYKKAIQLKSDYHEAYYNLGRTFHTLKKYRQAVDLYKSSIQLNSNCFEAHFHLGIAFHEQRRFKQAISCYQKAIELRPNFAKAYYTLGVVFHDQGALEEAILYYRKTIDLKSDFFEAHNGMGLAWQSLKQFCKALSCFKTALDLVPDSDAVYVNMGTVFQEQGRYNKALSRYRNALEINPENAVAHLNLGTCLMSIGKSLEAADSYRKALDLNPDYHKACAYLVGQLQKECAWQELKHWTQKLDDLTKRSLDRKEQPAETSFLNITRHADPAMNYAVAKLWCGNVTRPVSNSQRRFDFTDRFIRDRKITIGYLSNNFRNHPTAHLVHDLFGLHDRDRFSVFCYSYGINDGSPFRAKIRRNCDRFVELRNLSHIKSAGKIFEDKVDILVDLAGHTEGSRMEICSFRPAPLQVRYLGMPGTTGADYFDYVITDPIVIPEEHSPFYSEKFIYLPHCYQINSTRPGFSDYRFTRKNLGLPENDFVFCSFNTVYKLDSVMFGVWMRILKRVPGSVLWLLKGKEAVERNLRQEAETRYVDPSRLVFADKLPKNEHLARLRFADLALDTRIVNGAATTSDALWAGVPVLTLQGSHFASRMSSSIISAVGLQELITCSLETYETLAVHLAQNPTKLRTIKTILAKNRLTGPLFDTPRFVANLESAYKKMWELFLSEEKPRQISVVEN